MADPLTNAQLVSSHPTPILVAAAEPNTGQLLADALRRRGYSPELSRTGDAALDAIKSIPFAAAVVALPLPGIPGSTLLDLTRDHLGRVPVVVVGFDESIPTAEKAFDLGAHEHLLLPLKDLSQFLATLGVALGSRRGDRHLRYLRERDAPPSGWAHVIGRSNSISQVVGVVKQIVSRTSHGATPTIFLSGETGTGKGFLARCMHHNSVRRNRAFVEVNCAALPASLIESELFGHERGSFTDAKAARAGLFETADGGTLFLDEIASVPLDLQAKLLTAIEEKTVRRIGARTSTRVDVQILAATHEDLRERARQGTFRSDLFHRLNVVSVTMPPLRERAEDILLLAESFVRELCSQYGMPPRQFSPEAIAWMERYPWPGNVRELRNQLERIVLLQNDEIILPGHFVAAPGTNRSVEVTDAQGLLRVTLPESGVPLVQLEREIIREALSRCQGNVSRAARYLSISRQTLIYRMKKHGL